MIQPNLSERQQAVYDALKAFIEANGYPPDTRALIAATGINSSSMIRRYLRQLHLLGYIELVPNISRGIKLLEAS